MNKQTTELAFETNAEWDKQHALFPARIFDFLRATQVDLWESMHAPHGDGLKNMLLQNCDHEMFLRQNLF